MHRKKLKYLFPLLFGFAIASAQEEPVAIPEQTVSNTNEQQTLPSETNEVVQRQYRLGTIKVTGNYHFNELTIFAYAGLEKGQIINLPGEEISDAIKKLWKSKYFSDIAVYQSSVEGDVINLEIYLNELPRLKNVEVIGLKKA